MSDTKPNYDFSNRVSRARELMQKHGIDGLYVVAGPNMLYFTGFTAYQGGWPVWLSSFILPMEGDPTLIISDMHYSIYQAKSGSWVQDVRTYMDGDDPTGLLGQVLKERGLSGGVLGVEASMWYGDSELIQNAAPGTCVKSAGMVFDTLRMIKDAAEVENLRTANEMSNVGFAQARESICEGCAEYEAAMEIAAAMLNAGSKKMGVGGHFRDLSNRTFQHGDSIDVDIGGNYNGYGADTARMVFVGRPSAEIERMYRVTLEAYEAAMEVIKPGVPVDEVHRVCAGYMAKHGYEQVWKVGHGVGLGPVHEAPLLEEGNKTPLEPGMVFTVDPGCFIRGGYKDLPIHIEDNVLVTQDGVENLTTFTKEMIVV